MKRVTQLVPVTTDAPDGAPVSAEFALQEGKFLVPGPGNGTLHRERLTALIEQSVQRPVTVITAPPGAGKTVACAHWAAASARSRRIAWLSLDSGDREPARFWAGLATALAARGPGRAVPHVPRSRPASDDLPADLIAAVRGLTGSVVLVLDDVHVLADSGVLPGLGLLVHHAPAALRIVLCGRSVPGLHLAKMRLDGSLSELRGPDLACTPDEADAYLDVLGLSLGPAERDELQHETEGWMAGPRLAALITARDGDLNVEAIATDPIVGDYLRDELLDRQPPRFRQFLRRASIADRVTAAFAGWLTGDSGGAHILDQLERENSLVRRDRQGRYRCHPFLRQVLLAELHREMAAEVPVLYSRAARWAAGQGDVIEALRCVAEAQEWTAVPHVLTEAGLAGALPDRAVEFEAALGRLPEQRRADPAVAAALALVRLCRGDPESAGAYLGLARPALTQDAPGRLVIELWLALLRLLRRPDAEAVAAGRALAEKAHASAARQSEHQALGLLWLALGTVLVGRWEIADATSALASALHQLTAAGAHPLAARARGWLGLAAALGGDLAAAAELSGRLRESIPADPAASCLAALTAAQLAIEQDDLLLAARLLEEADAVPIAPLPGEPDIALLVALTGARAALAEGDGERAAELTRLVRERLPGSDLVLFSLDMDAALRTGDLTRAAKLAGPWPGQDSGDHQRPGRATARARLLLASGDAAAALPLALTVARAQPGGEPGLPLPTLRDRVTALVTATVAARRAASDTDAASLLEEALTIAEPHDLYRPFLDGGGPVHSAIALLIAPSSPAAGFATRVHERFVCQPSARAGGSPTSEVPALTASELAVLRLLRSYMSNQEIAGTLFLSVNTVKTHLRSVYSKLGVSSRREAVERGARLRIM